ncbi:glycoside hydrolase family 15 protein [Nannocystis punicea]|uniref:Glycoside hydrolase family 15 protein n=1 Tax=Nannocystis punicea TaxID=2995304 RepID=A0ABY7GU42_9BACT|nr:glycoside hydrolase family 15 protein [Nannocystis poenicansa]WAS90468.1 glycoside hydrolase family 15 protein [Nannocystis poenicansa]
MAYLPIHDHGIIGNMRTIALVGTDGAIDWFCHPRFDSPSVFASLLDDEKGGEFRICAEDQAAPSKQFYWPDTNILITRFFCAGGVVEIEDFMPVGDNLDHGWHHQIVRRVRAVRGEVWVRAECRPAFDYARAEHEVELTQHGAVFRSPAVTMSLSANVPLEVAERGGVRARFRLHQGDHAMFVFRGGGENHCPRGPDPDEAETLFRWTVAYWRRWLSRCSYRGRWRETVHRSALTLKLLTYEPTGAIVAAPTCGLPEDPGGVRNWDYRYTWMRDAAFTLYGFLRIGFTEEADAFMNWLDRRYHEPPRPDGAPLGLIYTVEGATCIDEFELPHLAGYRGARPVRIGNAAHNQVQLDIYGELLDAVYLSNKHSRPISYDAWIHLRRIVDYVSDAWHLPDHGIWEPRSGMRHNVNSKVMCWVALDRALRLADKRSFPAPRERWYRARDDIYETIFRRGWSDEEQSFVAAFDERSLDASALLMPLVFFLGPGDPRMLKTLAAIRRSPDQGGLVSDGLVYRYHPEQLPDGLPGREGTFNMCSFWLVEALTRAGRADPALLEEARLLFERMIGYGNHLGLYSEETGEHGEALGNFPQAFTHLSLISSAFNLERALG